MGVSVKSRPKYQEENNNPYSGLYNNPCRELFHIRQKRSVLSLYNQLFHSQYQSRKYCYTSCHTYKHSLGHYYSQIETQGEGHEAKGQKACYCGYRTSCNRVKGFGDSLSHGLLPLNSSVVPLLPVAVPEEYGIVHGYSQLQNSRYCLCDIRYISKEPVCSHVVYYRNSYADNEHHRQHPGIHKQRHYHHCQNSGNGYVYRLLGFSQFLQVCYKGAHSAQEAVFTSELSDILNSFY